MKVVNVRVDNEVVSVSLSRLSKSCVETELAKLQHRKYLLEKKKHAADWRSQQFQHEIDGINRQILALNSAECKNIIEEVERKKQLDLVKRHMAQLNAEQIMREFFGEDAHDKFLEEREYVFQANDGTTYKIIPEGTVFRQKDNDWEPLCLIRPRELPLPDFIVAAIISIKRQPQTYELRRR